jgi:hypothetical protein
MSIGWSSILNRGNTSATIQNSPRIDPHDYNRNQLTGVKGVVEPLSKYGSSRLPLTRENLNGTDMWGIKTSNVRAAPRANPSIFNATYLKGNPKDAVFEPAPEAGSRGHSVRVMKEHFGQPEDIGKLLKEMSLHLGQQARASNVAPPAQVEVATEVATKDEAEEKNMPITLAELKTANTQNSRSPYYINKGVLNELGTFYNLPTSNREQMLNRLYRNREFVERATSGEFRKEAPQI